MYKYLLSIVFVVLVSFSFAQETVETETTKGISPEVKEKVNKAKDRILLEFTLNQLTNKPKDFKLSALSRGFNAYFLYDVVLGKSQFSIAPGAGIGTENYYHKKNGIAWSSNTQLYDSITSFPRLNDSINVKKSKLGLTYFDIPIEFRYRSKPNKKGASWKVAAGFKVGFLLGSKWKYKGEDLNTGTGEVKFKEFKVDNMNKIRYGTYLRFGYGLINVFANYSISSLFETDKGPQMHPITFGIAITGL
ncbi:MAG: PorT family protein [Chitinophagales bacterium]|nr:PorT family protein [Chitinophagales bacterium]